ncbi:MAG: hypothetical protein HYU29_04190 [Chloroflexi bacterium]|nr:hypothetical protein [Chloroflexota bacterium]
MEDREDPYARGRVLDDRNGPHGPLHRPSQRAWRQRWHDEAPHARQTHLDYIHVESVDEYSAKVQKLGGKVVASKQAVPQIGYFAVALDPQGNPFGIFEDDPNAK